jgi:Tfp pilus assembly protein PilF
MVRDLAQQQVVGNAENHRVQPNCETEGNYGSRCKCRVEPKLAESVLSVGKHSKVLPILQERLLQVAASLPGNQALGEDPKVDFGAFLFRQGRTEEALGPLEKAVQEAPASSRANTELGRVLLHTGKLEAAAARLERAVASDPGNWNAHLLLGSAFLRLGRTEDGEREMRLGQEGWARKK